VHESWRDATSYDGNLYAAFLIGHNASCPFYSTSNTICVFELLVE